MAHSEVSSGQCVTNKVWEFLNAVLMMRVGPSISVFRHRSQTTFMLLDLRGSVRSDKGKGILKDVRYVVERRMRVNY
jgi:hypothetical protein